MTIKTGTDRVDNPKLEVSDSRFVGHVRTASTEAQARAFQRDLKASHPDAAHVPVAWFVGRRSSSADDEDDDGRGFDEDGEPSGSVGPTMVRELESMVASVEDANKKTTDGVAVAIVRYFGGKLLGVTCGRLSQCYGSVTHLALHRHFRGREPLEREFLLGSREGGNRDLFGMAAGDTELILNVVDDPDGNLLRTVSSEFEFGGFKGSRGEELPRLQNLQADGVSSGIIPVYRYPGNYSGDEWETYPWSPMSLRIKKAVETALLPLVHQSMNHCVTNLYRTGDDFIAHHSDKDLDLNRNGVIVSVSLGDERVMELRRRAAPHDTTRVVLPHGSMLVLGPRTNALFTHSILKKEGSAGPRLSLTLRHVTTFMDRKTGRLFGQGVVAKSIKEIRKTDRVESGLFVLGAAALAAVAFPKRAQKNVQLGGKEGLILGGTFAAAFYSFKFIRKVIAKRKEEVDARAFFSKASATGTKY